jgi:hypothetical protein
MKRFVTLKLSEWLHLNFGLQRGSNVRRPVQERRLVHRRIIRKL